MYLRMRIISSAYEVPVNFKWHCNVNVRLWLCMCSTRLFPTVHVLISVFIYIYLLISAWTFGALADLITTAFSTSQERYVYISDIYNRHQEPLVFNWLDSQKGGFDLLFHAGQTGWYTVYVKFSFYLLR